MLSQCREMFFTVSKVMLDFKTLPALVQLFTVLAHPKVIKAVSCAVYSMFMERRAILISNRCES